MSSCPIVHSYRITPPSDWRGDVTEKCSSVDFRRSHYFPVVLEDDYTLPTISPPLTLYTLEQIVRRLLLHRESFSVISKVKVIYDWITRHIAFDPFSTCVSIREILRNGKTIAAGFCLLFSKMVELVGVKECHTVKGFVKDLDNIYVLGEANHCWNCFIVDESKHYLIDCCLGSRAVSLTKVRSSLLSARGNLMEDVRTPRGSHHYPHSSSSSSASMSGLNINKKGVQDLSYDQLQLVTPRSFREQSEKGEDSRSNPFYFCVHPKLFIFTHWPLITKYQLLFPPLSKHDFRQLVYFHDDNIFKLCVRPNSTLSYRLFSSVSTNYVCLKFVYTRASEHPEVHPLVLIRHVPSGTDHTLYDEENNYTLFQSYEGGFRLHLFLPLQGLYYVKLFLAKSRFADHMLAAVYHFEVQKQFVYDVSYYRQLTTAGAGGGLNSNRSSGYSNFTVVSPIQNLLRYDSLVRFRICVPVDGEGRMGGSGNIRRVAITVGEMGHCAGATVFADLQRDVMTGTNDDSSSSTSTSSTTNALVGSIKKGWVVLEKIVRIRLAWEEVQSMTGSEIRFPIRVRIRLEKRIPSNDFIDLCEYKAIDTEYPMTPYLYYESQHEQSRVLATTVRREFLLQDGEEFFDALWYLSTSGPVLDTGSVLGFRAHRPTRAFIQGSVDRAIDLSLKLPAGAEEEPNSFNDFYLTVARFGRRPTCFNIFYVDREAGTVSTKVAFRGPGSYVAEISYRGYEEAYQMIAKFVLVVNPSPQQQQTESESSSSSLRRRQMNSRTRDYDYCTLQKTKESSCASVTLFAPLATTLIDWSRAYTFVYRVNTKAVELEEKFTKDKVFSEQVPDLDLDDRMAIVLTNDVLDEVDYSFIPSMDDFVRGLSTTTTTTAATATAAVPEIPNDVSKTGAEIPRGEVVENRIEKSRTFQRAKVRCSDEKRLIMVARDRYYTLEFVVNRHRHYGLLFELHNFAEKLPREGTVFVDADDGGHYQVYVRFPRMGLYMLKVIVKRCLRSDRNKFHRRDGTEYWFRVAE